MYWNQELLEYSSAIALSLITTYDVLKLINIKDTFASIISLITTYDVLKFTPIYRLTTLTTSLITTYDVLKFLDAPMPLWLGRKFNNNIWCIEIIHTLEQKTSIEKFNNNIWCIEISIFICFHEFFIV